MTKRYVSIVVVLSAAVVAGAQTNPSSGSPSAGDADFLGLNTPRVLQPGKGEVGVQLNSFRATDSLTRIGASAAYGFQGGWQAKIAGTFSPFDSTGLGNGGVVAYGGSAGELLLRYAWPGAVNFAIEGGFTYSNTPAQEHVVQGVAGASAGYAVSNDFRLYLNPRFVAINDNSILVVSFGAVGDLGSGVSVFGDFAPVVTGNNALSTFDGSSEKQKLYAIGLRFTKLSPGLSLDLAYTNMTGATYGFSATPSLGDTGGLYVGLTWGF